MANNYTAALPMAAAAHSNIVFSKLGSMFRTMLQQNSHHSITWIYSHVIIDLFCCSKLIY